jgi:hypothetical protein
VILKAIFAPRNSEISFTDTRMTSLYPLPLYKEVMFNPSKEQMFGPISVNLHYVIKFVSDLRQVGGFLRVLRFPPPIKPTATI